MAAQTNLTLNTVTYVPKGVQGQLASWINRASGVPGSFSVADLSVADPGPKGQVFRVTARLSLPIVATADTDCTCAGDVLRTYNATITILLPVTGTTTERDDFEKRVKDFVADSQFASAVKDLVLPTS